MNKAIHYVLRVYDSKSLMWAKFLPRSHQGNIKIGKDMLPQQLDFFDVELEEGLEEGLEEVQGQLELDELHSMEEVQVGLELDEIQGLQEYLVQELELDEGTRSVGRECVKEDKRPNSSWRGLVLDSGPNEKDDRTVVISV
ncbi:hypothetical protein Tco_1272165 [Tanacetum coccineum]